MLKKRHIRSEKIRRRDLIKHQTKRKTLTKFILLLSLLFAYWVFICTRYGTGEGSIITILTWSFFVLCTPIADAGFLLDFPVRILTRIRMFYSEIMVWCFAISLNIYSLIFNNEVYQKTIVLKLFHHILTNPYPYWFLIVVSAIGTFISVSFGDELLDIAHEKHRKMYMKHENKYTIVLFIFIFLFSIILYEFLLQNLGISISLF